MKWNELKRERVLQKASDRDGEKRAHRFCFSPILLRQRQFFDYFPLNLTTIFTSHFDSFLLHIVSFSIGYWPILLHVTLAHSVGNNHEAFASNKIISFSWHVPKFKKSLWFLIEIEIDSRVNEMEKKFERIRMAQQIKK